MSSSLVPSHVQVTVHKARDLNVKGKNGFSDVYFKLKVGKERQKVKTQNSTGDQDLCEWNHSTILPLMCLDTSLQVTVYSKATFEDKFLGYICIPLSGFNLFGKPVTNWHSLTVKPNKSNNKVKVKGEIEVTIRFVSSPENTTGLTRSRENLRKSNPTLLTHQDSDGSRRDLRDRIRRSFRRKKTPEQHASLDLEALNISLKEDHKYMSRPVSLAVDNGASQRVTRNLDRSSSEKEDNFKYFQEDSQDSEETQVRLQRRKFRRADSGTWGRRNSPRSCESLVQKNTSLDEIRNGSVASNTSIRSCSSESTSAYFSGSTQFDPQNGHMDRVSNSTNSSLEDLKPEIKQTQCKVDLTDDVIPLESEQPHSTPKTSPILRTRPSSSTTVRRRQSDRQFGETTYGVDKSPDSSPTTVTKTIAKVESHSSTPSLKYNTTGSEGYSPFNGKLPPPFVRAATHSAFTKKQAASGTSTTTKTTSIRPRSTVSMNRRSLRELRRSPEASKDVSKIFMLAKNAAAATTTTASSSSSGNSPVARRKSSTESSEPILEKTKEPTFVSSPSKKGHTVKYTKNSPMAHQEKFTVLPPSLQKHSSISGSLSLPTLSAFQQAQLNFDAQKPIASLDVTDGKETDNASTRRRPSKQLEHLFEKSMLGNDMALLEEKRLEEEQKLKEYRAASKEDLIKELMQQRELLLQKDSELESVKTYLDNLLIRVMEVNPSLLDTVSQHKPKS